VERDNNINTGYEVYWRLDNKDTLALSIRRTYYYWTYEFTSGNS